MRPPASVPEPGAEGGGATANPRGLPKLACPAAETVRCSPMGNRGEGATTADGPILNSPVLCIAACTSGGGPITVAEGTLIPARPDVAPIPSSGAGATAEVCPKPSRRDVDAPWPISGGGATIEVSPVGTVSPECPVEARGITGGTRLEAVTPEPIRLGRAGPFNFTSGAVRTACACSGATRIEPLLAVSRFFPMLG